MEAMVCVLYALTERIKMERYTNKHGLPEEVVRAIMKDRYTDPDEEPSDFSATTLVAPIQQTILKRRYPDQHIIRDVVDYFWAFIGSIAHSVLEEAWHESIGSIVEKRLYIEVAGKSVSGKMDCYHNGEIRDYKSTKSYKIMKCFYRDWETDRKSTRLNSSHSAKSRMPSSA